MNEETIFQPKAANAGQADSKKKEGAWKHVTLGGVSGILMGAGLLYAGQAIARPATEEPTTEEGAEASTGNQELQVAHQHDGMSFSEAFAAARAEVGPGGVFHWHGGIYNTYTAEEWNAMTPEQKNEFAEAVRPEVRPDEIPTPTDAHPDLAAHHVVTSSETDDVQVANVSNEHSVVDGFEMDGDVHIVGSTNVEGHIAVGYDTNNDGQPDVAIIDVDDSHDISAPDIIMDDQGNMATVGEVAAAVDPDQMAAMENPDVAPDMPDYMNDAMMEA